MWESLVRLEIVRMPYEHMVVIFSYMAPVGPRQGGVIRKMLERNIAQKDGRVIRTVFTQCRVRAIRATMVNMTGCVFTATDTTRVQTPVPVIIANPRVMGINFPSNLVR